MFLDAGRAWLAVISSPNMKAIQMQTLTSFEIDQISFGMGGGGHSASENPATAACSKAAGAGMLGGAIAGATGGLLGALLGAAGGLIAALGSCS